MARKKGKGNQQNEVVKTEDLSAPWLKRKTGFTVITVLSIGLMIFIAVQMIIQNPQEWYKGLLIGFLFGGSVWLVFFGFNWFHSLFRPKPKTEE